MGEALYGSLGDAEGAMMGAREESKGEGGGTVEEFLDVQVYQWGQEVEGWRSDRKTNC